MVYDNVNMDLNRIDWLEAQDLLLKLVQILKPLTSEKGERGAVVFRFFVPPPAPFGEEPHFRHPVSLLKTALDATQKQMDAWMEKLDMPKPASQTEPKKEEHSPVPLQAQRVITQVRNAIGSLCTSSNIYEPQAAPLREALKRLKPMIDELIEAVSHDGMPSSDQEKPPEQRLPLPVSPREHIKRLISLPAAPYLPQTRSAQTARKEKKKRKGFWFRSDEEPTKS